MLFWIVSISPNDDSMQHIYLHISDINAYVDGFCTPPWSFDRAGCEEQGFTYSLRYNIGILSYVPRQPFSPLCFCLYALFLCAPVFALFALELKCFPFWLCFHDRLTFQVFYWDGVIKLLGSYIRSFRSFKRYFMNCPIYCRIYLHAKEGTYLPWICLFKSLQDFSISRWKIRLKG